LTKRQEYFQPFSDPRASQFGEPTDPKVLARLILSSVRFRWFSLGVLKSSRRLAGFINGCRHYESVSNAGGPLVVDTALSLPFIRCSPCASMYVDSTDEQYGWTCDYCGSKADYDTKHTRFNFKVGIYEIRSKVCNHCDATANLGDIIL